jgi:hypothetical protein
MRLPAVLTLIATIAVALACVDATGPATLVIDHGGLGLSIVVDAHENLHAALRRNGFVYASCAAPCLGGMFWREGAIDAFDLTDPAIAVDQTERRHAVFAATTGLFLGYETCTTSCGAAASWSYTEIGGGPYAQPDGLSAALAVDATGRVHISHVGPNGLRYSRCDSDCTTSTNWHTVDLPLVAGYGDYPGQTAIAVDSTGRVHIALPSATFGLRYATCLTNCLSDTSWHYATLPAGFGGYVSLAVASQGVFVAGGFPRMHVESCALGCDVAANWDTVTLGAAAFTVTAGSHALAVERSGRLHVAYLAADSETASRYRIGYAVCDRACSTATSWRTQDIMMGSEAAIAVAADGGVHMLLRDERGAVRYLGIH